jgi:hypothetical protein
LQVFQRYVFLPRPGIHREPMGFCLFQSGDPSLSIRGLILTYVQVLNKPLGQAPIEPNVVCSRRQNEDFAHDTSIKRHLPN